MKKKEPKCDYENNSKDDVDSGAALGHPKYDVDMSKEHAS